MIMDELNEFADAENAFADGATVLVGDVVDLGAGGTGFLGKQMYLVLQVTTDFAGGTSVNFQLASDAAAAIATDGSASEHFETGAIPIATLVEGYTIVVPVPPRGGVNEFERYLGILAVNAGTNTAGAINAFLTMDPTLWKSYADGAN